MFTPGEGEDTEALTGDLVRVSRLPRAERPAELAKLVLGHPEVAPVRIVGICHQHSIKVPGIERDAPFVWQLFHALKYRPAPEQTRASFFSALGAVHRLRNRVKKYECVAKARLMFEPLLSGEDGWRLVEEVRLHPLLDNRDQRDAYELLRLAEVIMPLVREYAKRRQLRKHPPGTTVTVRSAVIDGARGTLKTTRFPDGTFAKEFTPREAPVPGLKAAAKSSQPTTEEQEQTL